MKYEHDIEFNAKVDPWTLDEDSGLRRSDNGQC